MRRNYPNWLKAYMAHTSYSESPDNFHLWTGVATIAGALRRRVWIDQRYYQWTPNFYTVIVGPPGVAAKSTSIRSGMSILQQVPGVHFGPQSMTWQALLAAFESATEGVELPDGEIEVMSCLTIAISELGTFLNPENAELTSILIDMWDGQKEAFRHSTKTQGNIKVQNPWLNIIACTTPSWLKENFPAGMISGGLTSRIIFVYGDKKRQYVAYPALQITHSDYEQEKARLAEDLLQIATIVGEYKLTQEAIEWGDPWYRSMLEKRPSHMNSERFDGYIARKQTHLHKLAMILAAAKRNALVVQLEDLLEAENLLLDTEGDMQKVFSSIGVSPEARNNAEIFTLVRNAKEISYQRLWQLCCFTMPMKLFVESVKSGLVAGYIERYKDANGLDMLRHKRDPGG